MNNREEFISLTNKLTENEKQFIIQILLDLLKDIPNTIMVEGKWPLLFYFFVSTICHNLHKV